MDIGKLIFLATSAKSSGFDHPRIETRAATRSLMNPHYCDANCGPGRTAAGDSYRRAKRISRTSAGIEKTRVNATPANMALISFLLIER
jgi:hypothetical protein